MKTLFKIEHIEKLWVVYRDEQLQTMGNVYLWKQREAQENFIAGFVALCKKQNNQ